MVANWTNSSFNSTEPVFGDPCFTSGSTDWREEYLTPTNFLILVATVCVEGLMVPFTILLNALVIWVVWRKRRLRKQNSCALLTCLAATDLMVGAVALPLAVTAHIMRLVGAGPICIMDEIAVEAKYFARGASLLQLVIISGERYIAIKHALRYETLVTTKRLRVTVGLAWAIPVAYTIVSLILGDNTATNLIQNVIEFVFIPGILVVISYCQVAMYLESRRHREHIMAHQVSEAATMEMLQKDKAARTTTMIVGVLCLCFVPSVVNFALLLYAANLPRDVVLTSLYTTDAFVYSNSLINPIIYCMRTRDLREAVEELFNREPSLPEVEPELARAGRRRGLQDDFVPPASQRKRQVAWSDPKLPRASRTRSLDLPKDSEYKPRTHRLRSA